MINFKAIPFLKILFPYVAGIICALNTGITESITLICMASFVLMTSSFLFQKYYKPIHYFKKGFFIFNLNIFLFVLAFQSLHLFNAKNHPDHYTKFVSNKPQSFIAVIDELPVETGKSIKLSLKLVSINIGDTWRYCNGNVLMYLKKGGGKHYPGNYLMVTSKFAALQSPKNPNEFDYREYLEDRNIFHTVFATPEQVKAIPVLRSEVSIASLGLFIKEHLVWLLRSSGLSQEAFSIVAALLMGYDEEIHDGVLESFSHSGTLHILSVSGMHTGILYAILIFIFSKIDKHERHKKLKCLVVILSLFLFVCITGFSPSVLRAVVMLSFVIIGQTFYKQGNSYNTLLLSAFFILLFNPNLVKDAGFLLSYAAVFGIMYLYPIFSRLYTFNHWIPQWFWTTVLMSVAATLFTLPISLFYFHQFPTWFIFANLVVIPLSIFIMALTVMIILFYKIAVAKVVLSYLINGLTSLMMWATQFTDKPGIGFIDNISFSSFDVLACTVLLLLCLWIMAQRQYKAVIMAGIALCIWLVGSSYHRFSIARSNELVVFHVKNKTAFVVRNGTKVFGHLDHLSKKEFQRFVKPYLLSASLSEVDASQAFLFQSSMQSVLWISKNLPAHIAPSANFILISNNSELPQLTNVKSKPVIIADCSNSYNFVRKLKKQCKILDLPFYSIRETGAMQIRI